MLDEQAARSLLPAPKIEASMFRGPRRLCHLGERFGMKMSAKLSRRAVSWIVWLIAIAVLLCSSSLIYAQGCAMCYTSAAASKAGALHALRSGILILLLPVLAMCSGISVIIYRSRDRFLGAAEWSPELDSELRAISTHKKDIDNLDPQEGSPLPVGGNKLPKVNGPQATDNGRPQVQL
jgi:hypothetical protein